MTDPSFELRRAHAFAYALYAVALQGIDSAYPATIKEHISVLQEELDKSMQIVEKALEKNP